ncbi:hypothetical protein [Cyanobium sp. Morenito 9A2]|uniref:hypothetical protein n=1 Tax=Cyanobium sp. Morenito 9A2 TaxID=2823718 RepID=UPI0020CC55D8|nr:hypothetical protein [Cyanobium sp. Morenito 9A2]MCP9849543.1 hypothetical protein [Cyanobium sp. Morenito 9A2]
MARFIEIHSAQFPQLPGEEQVWTNPGTVGQSLARYLQTALIGRGHRAAFVCCEDWGWWVELKDAPFSCGVCVYSQPDQEGPRNYVLSAGAPGPKVWSWRRLGWVNTGPWVDRLQTDLLAIVQADPAVEVVGVTVAFPW